MFHMRSKPESEPANQVVHTKQFETATLVLHTIHTAHFCNLQEGIVSFFKIAGAPLYAA